MVNGLIVVAAGILAAVAIATFAAVAADAVGLAAGALTIAGAAAGCIWLYKTARQRDASAAEALAARDERRFVELSALARSPGFELSIAGSSNVLLAVTLVSCGGLTLLWPAANATIAGMSVGMAILCFGVLMSIAAIPAVGKPVIVLSASGFKTPHTPFVQWDEVDGIFFQEIMSRGRSVSSNLIFRIPALAKELSRYSPLVRLLYPFRVGSGKEKVWAVLKNTSDAPTVVYRLARFLWTARTGRCHDWNPDMSESFNAALRQLDGATTRVADKRAFSDLIARDPGQAQNIASSAAQSARVIASELHRKTRILSWLAWSGIVVALLCFAALLARHLI